MIELQSHYQMRADNNYDGLTAVNFKRYRIMYEAIRGGRPLNAHETELVMSLVKSMIRHRVLHFKFDHFMDNNVEVTIHSHDYLMVTFKIYYAKVKECVTDLDAYSDMLVKDALRTFEEHRLRGQS